MTQQIPIGKWPLGLETQAILLALNPAEIARRVPIRFEEGNDSLDVFEAAVVDLGRGRRFALQYYPNAPVKGTTVVLGEDFEPWEEALRLLRIRPEDLIWITPELEVPVREAAASAGRTGLFPRGGMAVASGGGVLARETVPAALQEAATRAAELARNPVARSLLAAGLVTAAAALASQKTVRDSARRTARKAREAAGDAADAAADTADKIGAAMVEAATEAVRRLLAADSTPGSRGSKRGGRAKASARQSSGKSGLSSRANPAAKAGSGRTSPKPSASRSKAAQPGRAAAKKSAAASGAGSASARKSPASRSSRGKSAPGKSGSSRSARPRKK